jgi:hypothetical protein
VLYQTTAKERMFKREKGCGVKIKLPTVIMNKKLYLKASPVVFFSPINNIRKKVYILQQLSKIFLFSLIITGLSRYFTPVPLK